MTAVTGRKLMEYDVSLAYTVFMKFRLFLLVFIVLGITTAVEANAQYEKAPEFPGGNPAIQKYLTANLKYPEKARKKNLEGQVMVGFVVDKNGKVTNVGLLKSVHPSLDSEAVRVIRAMPKWKPALKGKENVAGPVAMPINFRLKNATGQPAAKVK